MNKRHYSNYRGWKTLPIDSPTVKTSERYINEILKHIYWVYIGLFSVIRGIFKNMNIEAGLQNALLGPF